MQQPGSTTGAKENSQKTVRRPLVFGLEEDPNRAAYATAVEQVPRMAARSLHLSDQQHQLRQTIGIASDAAAAALHDDVE